LQLRLGFCACGRGNLLFDDKIHGAVLFELKAKNIEAGKTGIDNAIAVNENMSERVIFDYSRLVDFFILRRHMILPFCVG